VFEFRELVAVSDAGEDPLLDALDEAASAQLVRAESGERFAFTHDKIREVLHDELNPIRRRRLHLRVAQRLEELHAPSIERHVDDLAFHFAEAGELRKALDYLRRAAEAATRVYAHDEALAFLERARECAEGLEDTAALGEVHERIGEVHTVRGVHGEAARHFGHAVELETDPARRAARMARQGAAYAGASDPRGVPVLEEALRTLDPATQGRERAIALAMIGRFHHYQLRHHESLRNLREAQAIAEALGDPPTLETVYGYLAGSLQHLARYLESNEVAHASIALGERAGLPGAAATGHEFLAENFAGLGQWEDAVRHARLDAEIATRVGSRDRLCWAAFGESIALADLGPMSAAVEAGERCIAIAESIGERRCATLAVYGLGRGLVHMGRLDEARAVIERAAGWAEELGQPFIRLVTLHGRAHLLQADGRPAEALAQLLPAIEKFRSSENRVWRLVSGRLAAELLLENGRLDEAEAYIGLAREVATENRAEARIATLDRLAAGLAAARGDLDGALRTLDAAIPVLDRTKSRIELGRALRARGGLRAGARDAAGAREDFGAARETFAEAGIRTGRTRLIAGRALDVMPRLTDAAYDLVLLDADKTEYGAYLEQALRLLRPGGLVAVDNALWHDRVADPAQRDAETVAIRELGRAVRDHESLLPVLLPVGDGLLVAKKVWSPEA